MKKPRRLVANTPPPGYPISNCYMSYTLQELDKKFSETTQYINMRKMMESKTATIQSLRSELKK